MSVSLSIAMMTIMGPWAKFYVSNNAIFWG